MAKRDQEEISESNKEIDQSEDGMAIESKHQEDVTDQWKEKADEESGPKEPLGKRHRLQHWLGSHKRIWIPLLVIILLVILSVIPVSRYAIAGAFWKQGFSVLVVDTETSKPVTNAEVTLDGQKHVTDNKGKVSFKVAAGPAKLRVEKKYYQAINRDVLVPIFKQKDIPTVKIKATGRQVSMTLINKITNKPLEKATISALDTKALTDRDGKATLVLPADKQTVEAVITADGYNELKQTIAVTLDENANKFSLTPSGQVFFLSDRTGRLDVVKTDLDGGNRQIVLAGTGKEDKPNTALLASRDWKYLALLSKRDGGQEAKLFLIETATGKLTTMDEGQATFSLIGWSDHRFAYKVFRSKVSPWQGKQQALKTFDADSKKLTTLDESQGEGSGMSYVYTNFDAYILKNEIVYVEEWQSNYHYMAIESIKSRKSELHSVKPDGSSNRVVKTYSYVPEVSAGAIDLYLRVYEPQGIWIKHVDGVTEEYEKGQVKTVTNVTFDEWWTKSYPTHIISPSSNKTFWSDARDGKQTLFVGDADAENEQEIAKLTEFSSYGWYGDDYLLVSKKGSELYIMPVNGGEALKLTDYYKPLYDFRGYGYGYGGF